MNTRDCSLILLAISVESVSVIIISLVHKVIPVNVMRRPKMFVHKLKKQFHLLVHYWNSSVCRKNNPSMSGIHGRTGRDAL